MVMGAGTGGTLTGISRKLKELDPNIKIIAVEYFTLNWYLFENKNNP